VIRSLNSLKKIVYLAAFLRSTAIGFISVFLGFYFVERGFSPFLSGILITAGLLGNAFATSLIGFLGFRADRKTLLLCYSFVSAIGGILMSYEFSFVFLVFIAFFGMLNGMGKDRSGIRAVDQTLLADAVEPGNRTMVYAHYNMLMDSGLILGAGLAGIPKLLTFYHGSFSFVIYGILFALSGVLYTSASIPRISEKKKGEKLKIQPETKKKIRKLSFLFSLDSLGGGFLTASLVSYWFFSRFHESAAVVAGLFFLARILNLLSNYGAVWISKQIGLVKTMVFTHLPASVCLILAAFSPYFWLAALFFLIRESFIQMDVPTRESYTMAIVEPHERSYASGITNAVRNFGWTIPPILAGEGMGLFQGFPLVAGSALKILYDLLLYAQFRHLKPPEET
jgi:MFS family permease